MNEIMTDSLAETCLNALRDTRDKLVNDLASMPNHKWLTRYHTDRRDSLIRVNQQIRDINERMGC